MCISSLGSRLSPSILTLTLIPAFELEFTHNLNPTSLYLLL
jgi:hypothetical protein